MMGVYIKGMEMPKNCCGCVFSGYTPTGKIPFCKRTGKDLTAEVYFNKRNADCPLIPVPPHGDLIDRKALLADTTDMLHSMMVFGGARVYTSDAIKNAPTIIPAEEVKE